MRQADPDAVASITERAVRLKKLTSYPEWAELRQAAEEDRKRSERKLFRDFTSRSFSQSVDQRKVDRHIGYWEGVEAVLKAPDKIEAKAQKMLETAGSAQQEGEQ